jgi:hypothetical protein
VVKGTEVLETGVGSRGCREGKGGDMLTFVEVVAVVGGRGSSRCSSGRGRGSRGRRSSSRVRHLHDLL